VDPPRSLRCRRRDSCSRNLDHSWPHETRLAIVEASSVWPDTVKRGEMVVQHRGLGSLVAEEILFVAAVTEGRVRKILVRPGTLVGVETVIVQLTSPSWNSRRSTPSTP
jgi:hypothetical protein